MFVNTKHDKTNISKYFKKTILPQVNTTEIRLESGSGLKNYEEEEEGTVLPYRFVICLFVCSLFVYLFFVFVCLFGGNLTTFIIAIFIS